MIFKDPHSYSDRSQGQIQHIRFQIVVDFDEKTLDVKAEYHLKEPISGMLSLDTRSLHLLRVHHEGTDLGWKLHEVDELLGQRLDLMELDQIQTFTIECQTDPASEALQWVSPGRTLGGDYPFLYSQCEPILARSIFPCQDSPSVRITYNASITVPEPLMVVMAAETLGSDLEGPSCTYHFKMPQPIPSYLFALAVGNLAFQEMGPRTGVYAEPEQLAAAAWEFAENEAKLEQAEKLFGPYKWDRYDLLIMPPTYPAGGMENPRLTFLTPMSIRGNREHTDIVSHELAHAWTGNLVTNASWEHFWLNEGWTTYAEKRISEVLYGVEHIQLTNYYDRTQLKRSFDLVGWDSPYARLRTQLEGIQPFTTQIPYIKGYTFLLLLERAVGRKEFDAFIKKYIETFQFKSLTTEEFIEFLKQELPPAFEQVDVDEWLYEPGLPESTPEVRSKFVDEVEAVKDKYLQGVLPDQDDVNHWNWLQTLLLIRALPETISVDDCQAFEGIFDIDEDTFPQLLSDFYMLCIRSGYEDIYPQVETLFSATGRIIVLMPVFRVMVETDWTRAKARPLYERVKEKHHPLTIRMLERVLQAADL